MFKSTLVLAGLAVAASLSMPAHGETIDTFSFTETGWGEYAPGAGISAAAPNTVLTGTFTGIVEPNGFIEQGDLTHSPCCSNPQDFLPIICLNRR